MFQFKPIPSVQYRLSAPSIDRELLVYTGLWVWSKLEHKIQLNENNNEELNNNYILIIKKKLLIFIQKKYIKII